MIPARPRCPECEAGLHRTCGGQAWDPESDTVTVCECRDRICEGIYG